MSQNITHDDAGEYEGRARMNRQDMDNTKADELAESLRTAYIADIAKGIENKELASLIAELCDWASDANVDMSSKIRQENILLLAKMIGKEINRSLELPA